MNAGAGPAARDAAWVRIETALDPAALREFCSDLERLFRVNSLYEIESWTVVGPDRLRLAWRNLANDRRYATEAIVEARQDVIRLRYATGLKGSTSFGVEPLPSGRAALVITDDYGAAPEAERAARKDEIDRSLVGWGHDLHRFISRWARWSRLAPWRWWTTRLWLPMTPKGRRIAYILIAVAVFELVATILVATLYYATVGS
ncbi:MAG: hypothetical protein FJX47_14540 [Alphaproteobacteria bacterium]|nr:hypothetical protein [Alphaproteobacteria bacterium]